MNTKIMRKVPEFSCANMDLKMKYIDFNSFINSGQF